MYDYADDIREAEGLCIGNRRIEMEDALNYVRRNKSDQGSSHKTTVEDDKEKYEICEELSLFLYQGEVVVGKNFEEAVHSFEELGYIDINVLNILLLDMVNGYKIKLCR